MLVTTVDGTRTILCPTCWTSIRLPDRSASRATATLALPAQVILRTSQTARNIRETARALLAGPRSAPGWTPRPAQLGYATSIAYFIAQQGDSDRFRCLVAHAGVGTGKSAGYLVPGVQAFAGSGTGPIVVATHTLLLMDQLDTKDLPYVASMTGIRPSTLMAKGQPQYLCFRRLTDAIGRGATPELRALYGVFSPEFGPGQVAGSAAGAGPRVALARIERRAVETQIPVGRVWADVHVEGCTRT
jgi:hypothetical protein